MRASCCTRACLLLSLFHSAHALPLLHSDSEEVLTTLSDDLPGPLARPANLAATPTLALASTSFDALGQSRRHARHAKRGAATETVYVTLDEGQTSTEIETHSPDDADGTVTVDVHVTPTETGTVYVTKQCDECEEETHTSTEQVIVTPDPVTTTCNACGDDDNGGGGATTTVQPNDDDDDEGNGDEAGGAGAQVQEPERTCAPGDENETVDYGPLEPTDPNVGSLIAIPVMFLCILIGWNLVLVRSLLYPAKILVTAWHEVGHIIAIVLSGASLNAVKIDPNTGGMTSVEGNEYPVTALPAGYATNVIIGGLLIFAGFNTLASKVASFFVAISIVAVSAWSATFVVVLLNLGFLGLLIGFWFIDHAGILRYFILFIGVMSLFYVIWDFTDDVIFRKENPSCCRLWELALPVMLSHMWALIWIGISLVVLGLFIIAGLAAWRETSHGMFCQSQTFLPT